MAGVKPEEPEEFSLSFKDLEAGGIPSDFCRLLVGCSQKVDSEPRHVSLHNSCFFTALPRGILTPFSHFVGPHKKRLVIISKHVQDTPGTNEEPFSIKQHEEVTIGLPLKQSKNFLNHSCTFPVQTPKKLVAVDTNARPLPLHVARYLSSCYAIHFRKNFTDYNEAEIPDLWILCETNKTDTIALGCSVKLIHSKPSFIFYEVCQSSDPMVIVDGKFFAFKLNSFLPKQKCSNPPTSSQVFSKYEFGPLSVENLTGIATSQMSMEFIWNEPKCSFTQPPQTSSEVVLSLQSTPGYPYSPVVHVYKEIQTLFQFSQISLSVIDWNSLAADSEEVLSVSSSSFNLVSQVQSFLDDATPHLLELCDTSIISPSAQYSQFQPRDDTDFLDKLWSFLKHVTNPSDLIDAFGLVFKSVLLRQVQPYIHQSKTSSLAKLFRRSLSVSTDDEHQVVASRLQNLLTEEKCLQCLIEIGVEKMERDYLHFFTSNNLAMASDVKSFFRADEDLLTSCIGRLCSLHCVLELTADLMTFVTLPVNTVTSFVKKALDHYRRVQVETLGPTPLFHLPFPAVSSEVKSLANFAASLVPTSMSGVVSNGNAKRVVHSSSEPLFRYLCNNISTDTNHMYVYSASCYNVN